MTTHTKQRLYQLIDSRLDVVNVLVFIKTVIFSTKNIKQNCKACNHGRLAIKIHLNDFIHELFFFQLLLMAHIRPSFQLNFTCTQMTATKSNGNKKSVLPSGRKNIKMLAIAMQPILCMRFAS